MTSGAFPPFKGGESYVVTSLYQLHPSVLGDLIDYITNNPPRIPISQIDGFIDQTPTVAPNINQEEATTSTAYTALTTPGPLLTNLPNGTYMVSWGALMSCSATTFRAVMGMSVNGAAPDDTKRAQVNSTSLTGGSCQTQLTLNAGISGNTLTAQYKVTSAGTGIFGSRYLVATRISGP